MPSLCHIVLIEVVSQRCLFSIEGKSYGMHGRDTTDNQLARKKRVGSHEGDLEQYQPGFIGRQSYFSAYPTGDINPTSNP